MDNNNNYVSNYLVIKDNRYKCKTTHTGTPYLRVNNSNYLDLTTESTTGNVLKIKNNDITYRPLQSTTTVIGSQTTVTVTSGYSGQSSTSASSTFETSTYQPWEAGFTSTASGTSALVDNQTSTRYSRSSTYTARSTWSGRSTSGYSGRTSGYRTTGRGSRSTTSRSTTYKGYTSSSSSTGRYITKTTGTHYTGYLSTLSSYSTHVYLLDTIAITRTSPRNLYSYHSATASKTWDDATRHDETHAYGTWSSYKTGSYELSVATFTTKTKHEWIQGRATMWSGATSTYKATAPAYYTAQEYTSSSTSVPYSVTSYAAGGLSSTSSGSWTVSSYYTCTDFQPWYGDFTPGSTGLDYQSGYASGTSPSGMYSTTALTRSYSNSQRVTYTRTTTSTDSVSSTASSTYEYAVTTGTLTTASGRSSSSMSSTAYTSSSTTNSILSSVTALTMTSQSGSTVNSTTEI